MPRKDFIPRVTSWQVTCCVSACSDWMIRSDASCILGITEERREVTLLLLCGPHNTEVNLRCQTFLPYVPSEKVQ